ncbi:MAG TPA: phosphoribosyltransferase family protein [Acidimicrobiales bacterium]|nr:phosphoribosyltransferase family protein [Acidimicrobiales bacterium]
MLDGVLLPVTCPACGAGGRAPCDGCRAEARPAPALPPPPGLDWCAALLAYEDAGREVVARLKYRNARAALPWLADGMAALVARRAEAAGEPLPEVVTWVPTTAARRRARGFDQGQLLAAAVARRLGVRCRPLLRRLPGRPQTGASRAERLAGPRLAPRRRRPVPAVVLVVDDVVTTGATLAAAAARLREAGATTVGAVAAARRGPWWQRRG